MRLKKLESNQNYPGKDKIPNEDNHINSKENVQYTQDKLDEISTVKQIDYDELPDGVYNFSGLAEIQHRKTKPNLRENEKLIRSKYKKDKIYNKYDKKDIKNQEEQKNIVEELFEAKKNNEKNIVKDFVVEKKENLNKNETSIKIEEKDNLKDEIIKENDKKIKVEKDEVKKEPAQDINSETEQINKEDEKNDFEQEQKYEEYLEDFDDYDKNFLDKIVSWFTPIKRFTFLIMFFLGIITQISFLASSRQNNLIGLIVISLVAISLMLIINVLNIKSKLIVFFISLSIVLIPYFNKVIITGNKNILIIISILLAIISLNLIFIKKNKFICFILAFGMYLVSYKIYDGSMQIFLIISILRIIKDIFNKKEKISNFLLHCVLVCIVLLGVVISC